MSLLSSTVFVQVHLPRSKEHLQADVVFCACLSIEGTATAIAASTDVMQSPPLLEVRWPLKPSLNDLAVFSKKLVVVLLGCILERF